MISNIEMKAILDLDLTAIKRKLMHIESGEGWTSQQADAVEREYKRFLYLMKAFPTKQTAPSVDVDTFWHYHILDTMKYAADCEQAFGYFLHHYPYVGMEGGADDAEVHEAAGECMRTIYEETFGETYLREILAGAADMPSVQATAYCSLIAPASNAAPCGGIKPRASATAYCGGVKPPVSATAYCGGIKPPVSATAYCGGIKPPVSAAAYCGGIKPPASAAAYCGGVKPPLTADGGAARNGDTYRVTQPRDTSLKAAA